MKVNLVIQMLGVEMSMKENTEFFFLEKMSTC